ncbi:MAG: hypothetical protein R3C52_01365 [Hyphomonadaceae bacterium]
MFRSLMMVALATVLGAALAAPGLAQTPEAPDRYAGRPAYNGVALWRLYRSSAGVPNETVQLATFDSLAGRKYTPKFNQNACETAARLMQEADSYNQRYWCEEYKPAR